MVIFLRSLFEGMRSITTNKDSSCKLLGFLPIYQRNPRIEVTGKDKIPIYVIGYIFVNWYNCEKIILRIIKQKYWGIGIKFHIPQHLL